MLGKISFTEIQNVMDRRILVNLQRMIDSPSWETAVVWCHVLEELVNSSLDLGCITFEDKVVIIKTVYDCLDRMFAICGFLGAE